MKPFDGLTVSQLAQELEAHDVSTTGLLKPEIAAKLQGILRGFLRVPSLLMYNPTQSLQDYNLHRYTVLDCEPLHDLKGHLHIFIKVETHLQSEVASACKDIRKPSPKKGKGKRVGLSPCSSLASVMPTTAKARQFHIHNIANCCGN